MRSSDTLSYVLTYGWTLSYDGTSDDVLGVYKALRMRGYDAVVLAPFGSDRLVRNSFVSLTKSGRIPRFLSRLHLRLFPLLEFLTLVKGVKERGVPKLVWYIHFPYSPLSPFLLPLALLRLLRALGAKVVVDYVDTLEVGRGRLTDLLTACAADALVTVSPELAESLSARVGRRCEYLPNFPPLDDRVSGELDDGSEGFVGELARFKTVFLFVDGQPCADSRLDVWLDRMGGLSVFRDSALVLIGGGCQGVRDACRKHGIRLFELGFRPHLSVIRRIVEAKRNTNVIALGLFGHSYYPTIPSKLQLYYACGLPFITSRLRVSKVVCRGGNGCATVDPYDPDEVSRAVRTLSGARSPCPPELDSRRLMEKVGEIASRVTGRPA
jgi:glycosyltransferase involved in cell wall biosynthesis